MITLNGGLKLTVHFEPLADGTTVPAPEEIKVRQIPVRDYDAGFGFLEDEAALVAFLCGQPKAWALTLVPASYEDILEKGREVNERGFFSFCRRRTEQAQKQNAEMITAMAKLPQETIRQAMEVGMARQNASRSPILSPGFVPPPVR